MTKRDHCTEDCTNICDVPLDQLYRIRTKGPVDCGCCKNTFYPFKPEEKVFEWRPQTTLRPGSKTITIYCEKCLDHFGAVTCPTTRGVKAFKRSKKIRDPGKVVPRRPDMVEWFNEMREALWNPPPAPDAKS